MPISTLSIYGFVQPFRCIIISDRHCFDMFVDKNRMIRDITVRLHDSAVSRFSEYTNVHASEGGREAGAAPYRMPVWGYCEGRGTFSTFDSR